MTFLLKRDNIDRTQCLPNLNVQHIVVLSPQFAGFVKRRNLRKQWRQKIHFICLMTLFRHIAKCRSYCTNWASAVMNFCTISVTVEKIVMFHMFWTRGLHLLYEIGFMDKVLRNKAMCFTSCAIWRTQKKCRPLLLFVTQCYMQKTVDYSKIKPRCDFQLGRDDCEAREAITFSVLFGWTNNSCHGVAESYGGSNVGSRKF